jgi:hypothetical protein
MNPMLWRPVIPGGTASHLLAMKAGHFARPDKEIRDEDLDFGRFCSTQSVRYCPDRECCSFP